MSTCIALKISSGSFYALAVLSAIAIAAPIKWPKSSAPLAHRCDVTRRGDIGNWVRTSPTPAEKSGIANFETNQRRRKEPNTSITIVSVKASKRCHERGTCIPRAR